VKKQLKWATNADHQTKKELNIVVDIKRQLLEQKLQRADVQIVAKHTNQPKTMQLVHEPIKKIAGVFCEKNDTGEKVCKFEVKEGKICGKSTRKSDHPYCARHGQKTTELIPIYDVSSSPCSFVNCTQVALSGTNLCSMHTGICPFNGCGLKVLGATGMCAQRHVLGVQRCRCGGCTEPAMSDGLCVYHLAKGCNERWNWFKRNMERMTATQSKTMANNCGSNCCGSTKGGKCKFAACNPGTCDVDGQRLTNAKAAAKRAGNKSAQAKLGKMKCDNCGIMM